MERRRRRIRKSISLSSLILTHSYTLSLFPTNLIRDCVYGDLIIMTCGTCKLWNQRKDNSDAGDCDQFWMPVCSHRMQKRCKHYVEIEQ